MRTPLIAISLAFSSFLALSCGVQPLSVLGDQCDLTSECNDPLVCALGRCRNECDGSRDCALGQRCIQLKMPDLGVCQLPDETSCSIDSDCPDPLVCTRDYGCMIDCADNTDCAAGAECVDQVCVEPLVLFCNYDSNCKYPLICGRLLACQQECTVTSDCVEESRMACVPHGECEGEPCMCRVMCPNGDVDCPRGTGCVTCDGAGCGTTTAYCERPDPEGMGTL